MGLTNSTGSKLDTEELKLVSESWSVVMQKPEENGVAILKAFLDKHDYYSKFKKFQGIPVSELPGNKAFRSHALAIIRAIDNITKNINDDEALKSLLLQLGKQHFSRKVTEKQFQELQVVIVDILRTAFNLPEESLKAWNKTFDIAFGYVYLGMQ